MSSQIKAAADRGPRDDLRRPGAVRAAFAFAVILALAGSGPAALAAASPAAAGDAAAGLAKSAICASCHGPLGLSPVPTYPNLAGQNRLYLAYALHLYRSGERRGDQAGMMYTVAQALSDTDIDDLAAYYAALPRPD
jgi:cytochrome c553